MTTYFVSRHPGALEWATAEGIAFDTTLLHLDASLLRAGDTVIGTLPVSAVAEVYARGGRYLHLAVSVPFDRRGTELTANDLRALGACLREYRAERVA